MKPTKTILSNPTTPTKVRVGYHVTQHPSKLHVFAHIRALPVQLLDKHFDDTQTHANVARMLASSFPSADYFRDNWPRGRGAKEAKQGVGEQSGISL